MTTFISILIALAVGFISGYFVGSRNPAASVKARLLAELQERL